MIVHVNVKNVHVSGLYHALGEDVRAMRSELFRWKCWSQKHHEYPDFNKTRQALDNVNSFFGLCFSTKTVYCANPKTVNTRIISGMLLCCEEKANQMQDEKTVSCSGN